MYHIIRMNLFFGAFLLGFYVTGCSQYVKENQPQEVCLLPARLISIMNDQVSVRGPVDLINFTNANAIISIRGQTLITKSIREWRSWKFIIGDAEGNVMNIHISPTTRFYSEECNLISKEEFLSSIVPGDALVIHALAYSCPDYGINSSYTVYEIQKGSKAGAVSTGCARPNADTQLKWVLAGVKLLTRK